MGREQITNLTWSSGVGQALWGTQTPKFLSPDDYVNDLHVDANARPQGHLKFIDPTPGYLLLCKSPGARHTFRCKSPGGMVTGQIDTCITRKPASRHLRTLKQFCKVHVVCHNLLYL